MTGNDLRLIDKIRPNDRPATFALTCQRLLLEDGVDVNSIARYSKRTPLSAAASQGAAIAVELLLSNGADVNALDQDGSTPLMNACTFGKTKGYLVAQQLIAAGANVNIARSDERTAMKAAIDGMNADLLQLLIDNGAEVDGPKGTNQTALMLAARNGDVKMLTVLTVLIENGADRTLQCKLKWAENRTALGLAELEKRRNAVTYLKSLEEKQDNQALDAELPTASFLKSMLIGGGPVTAIVIR